MLNSVFQVNNAINDYSFFFKIKKSEFQSLTWRSGKDITCL